MRNKNVPSYAGLEETDFYRPVITQPNPEDKDQGDPYMLASLNPEETNFKHYIYHTDNAPAKGEAITSYGTNDLRNFERIGKVLLTDTISSHWAPCVVANNDEFVMFYSRSEQGEVADSGHRLRRAVAARPEGPFVDQGELPLPQEYEFTIDADVFWQAGKPQLAFVLELWDKEPYGVGLAQIELSPDLSEPVGEPKILARPGYSCHLFEAGRNMFWRKNDKYDGPSGAAIDWYCIEAPVGGITSPQGKSVYLYSSGNYQNSSYAIGALREDGNGQLIDLASEGHFVLESGQIEGLQSAGHPSLAAPDLLIAHGRFSPGGARQAFFAPLLWDEEDRPYCPTKQRSE